MRETFVRKDGNERIHIDIDLAADQYKKLESFLLSVFVKINSDDFTSLEFEEFLEIKESLIIALNYEDKAHFLASRVVDGWCELYFCSSDSKELNSMVSAVLKDTNYVYESNVTKDKKWNFYETQLFPNEIELIHIESLKIINLLKDEEDMLEEKRDVEHYVSFTTPTQKEKFVHSLDHNNGFFYKDDLSSEDFEHGVALVKKHAVTEDVVEQEIEILYKEISKYQGFYEGWSTTLVEEVKK